MRLPEFLLNLFPLKWVWKAFTFLMEIVKKVVAWINDQLSVSTAEEGLSLWEKDYSLPSDGDIVTRRRRILAALQGEKTLTRGQLASLAVMLAEADEGVVEENFPDYEATLIALYHERLPESIAALEEAVQRLRPAHLKVEVVPAMGLTTAQSRYLGQYGGVYLHITSEEGGTTV